MHVCMCVCVCVCVCRRRERERACLCEARREEAEVCLHVYSRPMVLPWERGGKGEEEEGREGGGGDTMGHWQSVSLSWSLLSRKERDEGGI